MRLIPRLQHSNDPFMGLYLGRWPRLFHLAPSALHQLNYSRSYSEMICIERLCLIAFLITGISVSAAAPKAIAPDVLLTVGGEVDHPMKLTRADLDKFA